MHEGYLSLPKGEEEGEGFARDCSDDAKPLTLVLSPSARGEAIRATSWSVCI